MSNEGSVAPPERINVIYKPASGGPRAEVELPLKMLMIGDYTLRKDDRELENRKPINIDKENFNEVMKSQKLELALSVPNKLSDEESGKLPLHLELQTMKDFNPSSVVNQVPELKKLQELREALQFLKGPLGNVPAFCKKIKSLLDDGETRKKLLSELGMNEAKQG